MPTQLTPRWANPYPQNGDVPSIPAHIQALAVALDDVAKDDQGVLASRPTSTPGTPGKRGRYYYATDTSQLFRDNGTGWDEIPIGGVINADVAAGAAIAESKLALASDAAAGTASRRTLGTGAAQAAPGDAFAAQRDSWKTYQRARAYTPAAVNYSAAQYMLPVDFGAVNDPLNAIQGAGANTARVPAYAFYVIATDYESGGLDLKGRIRGNLVSNAVSMGAVTVTFGLSVVNTFGGLSGEIPWINTLSLVAGSQPAALSVAANAGGTVLGPEFSIPGGLHMLTISASGALPAGCRLSVQAELQTRLI